MSSQDSPNNRSVDQYEERSMTPQVPAALPIWRKSTASTMTTEGTAPQGEIVTPRPERLGSLGPVLSAWPQPHRATTSFGHRNIATDQELIYSGLIPPRSPPDYASAREDKGRTGGRGRTTLAVADEQGETVSGSSQRPSSKTHKQGETTEQLRRARDAEIEKMGWLKKAHREEIDRLLKELHSQSGQIERSTRAHIEEVERLRLAHAEQVRQLMRGHAEQAERLERLTSAHIEQLQRKDELIRSLSEQMVAKDAQIVHLGRQLSQKRR